MFYHLEVTYSLEQGLVHYSPWSKSSYLHGFSFFRISLYKHPLKKEKKNLSSKISFFLPMMTTAILTVYSRLCSLVLALKMHAA